MSGSTAARVCGAALLFLAAACSNAPTAPSPVSSGASIGRINLEPPPVPPRIGADLSTTALGATKFVAFGDSITYGTLSSFDGMFLYDGALQAYPNRLELGLSAHHAAQAFSVANEGVPGETARAGEGRLPGVLGTRRPHALLLLEGINDMNGGTSATRAASSVANMVNIARLYNVTVLVATMFQTYESEDPNGVIRLNSTEKIVPFNTELKRLVAGLQNVHVVDLYQAFGSNTAYIGGDGLHPSELGYQRIAQEFELRIEQVFPVRGGIQ